MRQYAQLTVTVGLEC